MWKVRDKGAFRGQKFYRRHYKLDLQKLYISYFPNKSMAPSGTCAGGGGVDAAAASLPRQIPGVKRRQPEPLIEETGKRVVDSWSCFD